MGVRRFRSSDWEMVDRWIKRRGLGKSAGDRNLYPPLGWVIDGIACGFLYETKCKLAYTDGWFADPDVPREVRGQALDLLIETVIKEARIRGYSAVGGTPTVETMLKRLCDHGFVASRPGAFVVKVV